MCNEVPVVLVVDDSPEYLQLVGSMLAPLYTVRVASSGRRALQLVRQAPLPDLILLDIVMPEMDGHSVLTALRADPLTAGIPTIFLTSAHEDGDELAALSEGAVDYIVKPATPALVRARVRNQIELKQTRDRLSERNIALQQEVESHHRTERALEAAMAEMEAFSYTVSHDLRAPLAAVQSFAGVLLESEASALSEQGRHRLDRIVAGAQRMNRMIDDILACSRVERAEMRCGEVDLNSLVAEVVAEAKPLWPVAAVVVEPLPNVGGDAGMLRQIFANLIGNALKFSSARADARVEVAACRSESGTEIRVRDNGAGFDPAYAGKLFGMFQRLHSEAEFSGTGVGLAIVKRLVQRHGGQVRAQSVPDGWTTFSFTLGDVCAHALPASNARANP
jgi:signal transduction histidine kinase